MPRFLLETEEFTNLATVPIPARHRDTQTARERERKGGSEGVREIEEKGVK